MRVLVTGGAGLLGLAVRARLRRDGHHVVAVDRTRYQRDDPKLTEMSLDDVSGLTALVRVHSLDTVVHCGAISGPMMAKGQPMAIVDTNIVGTANILEVARAEEMRRVVFCSSISVYGNAGRALMTEEFAPHPTSVYAASKAACEQLVEGYAAEYGVDGVSLRIARVYGPYRRADCFIRDMIAASRSGAETVVPCNPAFLYHYIYVEDVADAVFAAMKVERLPARVYNVGSDEVMTMPDIVRIAREVLPDLNVRIVEGQDDVPDVQEAFDTRRIAADLGFHPSFDLACGIAAYARAFPEPTSIT
jgi:UDP-glucuronate 4-epimerase